MDGPAGDGVASGCVPATSGVHSREISYWPSIEEREERKLYEPKWRATLLLMAGLLYKLDRADEFF